MVQAKTTTRGTVALLAAALTLASGPAVAGTGGGGNSVAGETFVVCGKFVLKLRDFGKYKVNDYNNYIPPNFQTTPGHFTPTFTFVFSPAPSESFVMAFSYPDEMGNSLGAFVTGTYRQRGKKLNFEVNDNGASVIATLFRNFSQFTLFGERAVVADVPYAMLTNQNKLRFKGRLKDGGDNLKVKFKGKMLYDIQYDNLSEYADQFNVSGRIKLRAQSKKCPTPSN